MGGIWIVLGAVAWLAAAYRLWGRWLDARVLRPDDGRPTPAHSRRDGVDFFPARPLVLFGHHFASIAGAGPIIGPVVAVAYFGFGVSLAWILVGVVFIGAVHDYTTAMVSVRRDGRSVSDIAGDVIGRTGRLLFQIFVWVTLLFVVAVFLIAAQKTFVSDPRVVIPAWGMIGAALVFGWLHYRLGWSLAAATGVSLVLVAGLFVAGDRFPVVLHALDSAQRQQLAGGHVVQLAALSPQAASQVWIGLLILYAAVAAVLPVQWLLQPRDYMGYWILAVGMAAGFAGVLWTRPVVSAPALVDTTSQAGPLWPMLFILVACGAVSGFHSLVASGTTSKQLDKETHGRPVVFGAMLVEGLLAVLALLTVAAGVAWPQDAAQARMVAAGVVANPIGAFATGFGAFTAPLLGRYGAVFGVVMINAFVLTTLDTSLRLARFITHELAPERASWLHNRFVATALVAAAAWGLAATGSVGTLWKMFGASNQLVAALALVVASAALLRSRRPWWYTALPAAFMLATTCGALVWQGWHFARGPAETRFLAVVAAGLLIMALLVAASGVRALAAKGRVGGFGHA